MESREQGLRIRGWERKALGWVLGAWGWGVIVLLPMTLQGGICLAETAPTTDPAETLTLSVRVHDYAHVGRGALVYAEK
jgi:hypothetical protein